MCIEDIRELLKEAEVVVSEDQLKFIYENLESLVVTGSPHYHSRTHLLEKECKELRQELDKAASCIASMSRHEDCYYCGGTGIVDEFYVHRCSRCSGYGVRRKV